ncbi:interferon regulatory factor 5-like isoform X2 [Lethenteron reissneri]|uniref:interferon regulatory factor 5-like isoform X2 n=1 Tax=Lethenteron reissneri TaxID=7753 RepID=UPI002AB6A736|nr:interferon regulatory factor 5-like isoform X2 [Lethenteron reissneri]XP_061435562.1 interferon regulatory factor 5-like isoform X2 [Lethenteron reissneri]XP_061435563.1 interferon regulatory factor 5-like isoform X2 [Lethenteron reissneri]
MAAGGKTLLWDWLSSLADSGSYGLSWGDAERTSVRIPWHPTSAIPDGDSIFKGYAVLRCRDGLTSPSTWRQSLRCALRSTLHCVCNGADLDPPQPFRIYARLERRPHESPAPIFPAPPDPDDVAVNVPMTTAEGHELEQAPTFLASPSPENVAMDKASALRLTVTYRGLLALSQTVGPGSMACDSTYGCLLFHGALDRGEVNRNFLSSKEPQLFPVMLPRPPQGDSMSGSDRRQVQERLELMENGLLLEVTPLGIFCTRLCRCRVYVSGPETQKPQGDPQSLPRPKSSGSARQLIFDFKEFQRKMQDYIRTPLDSLVHAPSHEVTLCIGTKWPDGEEVHRKPIAVRVEHLRSHAIVDGFKHLGVCPRDARPDCSDPNSADRFLDLLKKLELGSSAYDQQQQQ